MWWRLGVARRIQALIFLLIHKLDASRHFLANFLVILDHIIHLKFTDCFAGKGLALDSNNDLQILSKPLLFLSQQVPYTRTDIANAIYSQCLQCISTRHLSFYHYITAFNFELLNAFVLKRLAFYLSLLLYVVCNDRFTSFVD